MRLDASGYVFKSHAEDHLLLAIDAVLAGKRFVSWALARVQLRRPVNEKSGDGLAERS